MSQAGGFAETVIIDSDDCATGVELVSSIEKEESAPLVWPEKKVEVFGFRVRPLPWSIS